VKKFTPPARAPTAPGASTQRTSSASQEFRKCIECYLCQDVCHVLREHHLRKGSSAPGSSPTWRRWRCTPLDTEDRLAELKGNPGVGFCNITKCCTRVCPEEINITDNAIIPLKERVVDEMYDPLRKLFRLFRGS